MDENKIFYCPANVHHKMNSLERFKNHTNKCSKLFGKTYYFCRFSFPHQFDTREKKNAHELDCIYNVKKEKDFQEIKDDVFYIDRSSNTKPNNYDWYDKNKGTLDKIKKQKQKTKEMKHKLKQLSTKEQEDLQLKVSSLTHNQSLIYEMVDTKKRVHKLLLLNQIGKQTLNQVLIEIQEYKEISECNIFQKSLKKLPTQKIQDALIGEFYFIQSQSHISNYNEELEFLKGPKIIAINALSSQELVVIASKFNEILGNFLSLECDIGIFIFQEHITTSQWLNHNETLKVENLNYNEKLNQEQFFLKQNLKILQNKLIEKREYYSKIIEEEKLKQLKLQKNIEDEKIRKLELLAKVSEYETNQQQYKKKNQELKEEINLEYRLEIKKEKEYFTNQFNIIKQQECTRYSKQLSEIEDLEILLGEIKEKGEKLKLRQEEFEEQQKQLQRQAEKKQYERIQKEHILVNIKKTSFNNPQQEVQYENLSLKHLCLACTKNIKEVIYFPCGHLIFCKECQCIYENAQMKLCPYCKQVFYSRMPIFIDNNSNQDEDNYQLT